MRWIGIVSVKYGPGKLIHHDRQLDETRTAVFGRHVMRSVSWIVAASAVLVISASARADWVSVDGNLSEWGVGVPTNSDFISAPGLTNLFPHTNPATYPAGYPSTLTTSGLGFAFSYMYEDGVGANGYVEPQFGGQDFDLEFMGVAYEPSVQKLYIAIVSGQRPDNGASVFEPGDIQIQTSRGKYGIEVGGGKGGAPINSGPLNTRDDKLAIEEGAWGTTYSGHPSAGTAVGWEYHRSFEGDPQTAGSIWKTTGTDDGWLLDFLSSKTPSPPYLQSQIDPRQVENGNNTFVGTANYIYTRNGIGANDGGQHSIIELAIDLAALGFKGGDKITRVVWQPGCANDILDVGPDVTVVPAPGAIVLLGTGLATALAAGWRRRFSTCSPHSA